MAGELLDSMTGDCTRHDLSTDDLTTDVVTMAGKLLSLNVPCTMFTSLKDI